MNIGESVLLKNNQFIAFNKPAGIPVQQDPTGDKCLLDLGEIYCKCRLHLVNRIDRPASGVVLFAKSPAAMTNLTRQFQEKTIEKIYWAVVKNKPENNSGTLKHLIQKKTNSNSSQIVDTKTKYSEEAELEYNYLCSSDNYHLLEIRLLTGRHHQIRAQLAAIGCPVKGDVKYGFDRGNKDRSIHLHSRKLSFLHPVSNELVSIEANPPDDPVWNYFTSKLSELD